MPGSIECIRRRGSMENLRRRRRGRVNSDLNQAIKSPVSGGVGGLRSPTADVQVLVAVLSPDSCCPVNFQTASGSVHPGSGPFLQAYLEAGLYN